MSNKQIIEAGLMLGGAALGAAGAVVVEPIVIGLGVLAAGAAAVMRYNDRTVGNTKHHDEEVFVAKY